MPLGKIDVFLSFFCLGDFTLDPNTAIIRTRKNLERQQTFSYTLTVGVSDQGKPSRVGMVRQLFCNETCTWHLPSVDVAKIRFETNTTWLCFDLSCKSYLSMVDLYFPFQGDVW